jgi:hypothetical protein
MFLSPQSQQTNPLRNYGSNEQALFGSTPGGGKNHFRMVHQFQMTYHRTPRQQIQGVDNFNQEDDRQAIHNSKKSQEKYWMPHPSRTSNPSPPSFYEQTERPPILCHHQK